MTVAADRDLSAFDGLFNERHWVAWKTVQRSGKPTKIPFDPNSGNAARTDDPSTWAPLAAARQRAQRLGPRAAIGWVLGDVGNDLLMFGCDLDSCLHPESGEAADWAEAVIDRLRSYAEISPSGWGLKLFAYAAVEDRRPFLDRLGVNAHSWGTKRSIKGVPAGQEHGPAIEIYTSHRFFTVTGVHWPSSPPRINLVDWPGLQWLADYVLAVTKAPRTAHPATRGNGHDTSRSAQAFRRAAELRRRGCSFEEMVDALKNDPDDGIREWVEEKGKAAGGRELRRLWERTEPDEEEDTDWDDPDLEVLRQHRRPPPSLPLDVFGLWGDWIVGAADAAAAPPDYVAMPLLAGSSVLIGNSRWARATVGWAEPPHLWTAVVGDSGDSKSPGGDTLLRDVIPEIERRMVGDFPDQLRDWQGASEAAKAAEERWRSEVRDAGRAGRAPPLPPPTMAPPPEPQKPRLRQHDVTIERVATLLATAAPKGLLIVRDELAGWVSGMNVYNDAGRSFWVEAYGGRPYRVERQRQEPIEIPRLVVAVVGSTQPDKIAEMLQQRDDGLLSRFLWAWPDPVPFRLGRITPDTGWAITALDRLRELRLRIGDPPQPIYVPLDQCGQELLEAFGRDMQDRRGESGGLLRSAYGKARGVALRLSLVLEYLWWCTVDGFSAPPSAISPEAIAAAVRLVSDYFVPMAERVYGDAAAPLADRNAATLARWIVKSRPDEVYVRDLQRKVRLPGLRTAEDIHAAARVLVEAGWLQPPPRGTQQGRARSAYMIKPRLWELLP